jgi:hypothetical protein
MTGRPGRSQAIPVASRVKEPLDDDFRRCALTADGSKISAPRCLDISELRRGGVSRAEDRDYSDAPGFAAS